MRVLTLRSWTRRQAAKLIEAAPDGYVLTIKPPTRSDPQNRKMWALLGDVSKAKPKGRNMPPEAWKLFFVHALGHECRWEEGLDGELFPIPPNTSKFTKQQMSDLIELIYAYGSQNGVTWSEDYHERS